LCPAGSDCQIGAPKLDPDQDFVSCSTLIMETL
jgi:hypothetical protein